jgi:hypothetical protein
MLNNLDFVTSGGVTKENLLEEKASMEKRLKQLGYDGDCAYERAMVAFYNDRLEKCCALLEASEPLAAG